MYVKPTDAMKSGHRNDKCEEIIYKCRQGFVCQRSLAKLEVDAEMD